MEREFLKNKIDELEELRAANRFEEGKALITEMDAFIDEMDEDIKDVYIPLANWVDGMWYCLQVINNFFCDWKPTIQATDEEHYLRSVFCNRLADSIVKGITSKKPNFKLLKCQMSTFAFEILGVDDFNTVKRFTMIYPFVIAFAENEGFADDFKIFKADIRLFNKQNYEAAIRNYKLLKELFSRRYK